jgi:hypothetical protein
MRPFVSGWERLERGQCNLSNLVYIHPIGSL